MMAILRMTIFLALALLAAACQRSVSDSERGISDVQATHPWQLPSGAQDYTNVQAGADRKPIPADGQVEQRLERGPQFSGTDTLDEGLLPGSWVMVGICSNERLDLRSHKEYATMVLQQSGGLRVFDYDDGVLGTTIQGSWRKSAPGVLVFSRNDQNGVPQDSEVSAEMFGPDFLYIWSYSGRWGNWYVRQTMDEPYQQIGYNRYTSDLGSILFTNSGQQSFYGELTTPEGSVWQLNGYLVDGVLNMAWVDSRNNASGFAAFIIEDGWDRLRGVYWKNDYEAAPFTDQWLAEADR